MAGRRKSIDTGGTGRIVKVAKVTGQPGVGRVSRNWPRVNRPMRAIRTMRTLIKQNVADGASMPEFKNTLQRAGVGRFQRAITIIRQKPVVPPRTRDRDASKVISPPSPTNRGGARSPYHK